MKNKIQFLAPLLIMFVVAGAACVLKTSSSTTTDNTNTIAIANAEPESTPTAAAAESRTATPEALVADLYKQHDADKSPFFQTKNRALVDKYFTKSTADLIWKDATSSKGEVGALDGDPLYAAQDMEIKNFAVGKSAIKGDTATVAVNFTNYGQKNTVTFQLKMVKNAWKIDDIIWSEGNSMVKVIKNTYSSIPDKETGSKGEFEGRYQVGDTSCTVKPVKMAFELKWAKGSGTEMLFFKDGTTFESELNKEGKSDSFVFDDDSYNTGTFYRADGETFTLNKAK